MIGSCSSSQENQQTLDIGFLQINYFKPKTGQFAQVCQCIAHSHDFNLHFELLGVNL